MHFFPRPFKLAQDAGPPNAAIKIAKIVAEANGSTVNATEKSELKNVEATKSLESLSTTALPKPSRPKP